MKISIPASYLLALMILAGCAGSKKAVKTSNPILTDFVGGEILPIKESHASTIEAVSKGNYLVSWFGGTKEGHDDVGIYLSKGKPGNWSKPAEIFKLRNDAHWNPVLFKSPDGVIHLYFKIGKKIPTWETWHSISKDEGNTWSKPAELVAGDKGGRGPVRNKPVLLSDGSIIAGASTEEGQWDAFADISKDNGNTWTRSANIKLDRNAVSGRGVIQPTLWESSPGHVHMLVRSTANLIYRSDSKDYGKTWTPFASTTLPNPNSAIDLARIDNTTLVLLYNPAVAKKGDRGRGILHAALSFDNGLTWPKYIKVEDELNAGHGFAYPAVIYADGKVTVTYTVKRKQIKFWQISKKNLLKNAISY
jgi:predicted neuraminidase